MEIQLLEQHLIQELPTHKRVPLIKLLEVLDRIQEARSSLYNPDRVLGQAGDPSDLQRVTEHVRTFWQRLTAELKPTDKSLVIELLRTRDIRVRGKRLYTPKGQFLLA
jgi:hypothetical protein